MLTPQQALNNLHSYRAELNISSANIGELRSGVSVTLDKLNSIDLAIDKLRLLQQDIDGFRGDIDKIETVLNLMNKAGPLKVPAKVAERLVDKVDDVATSLDRKIDQLIKKINQSKLKSGVDKATKTVENVDQKLISIDGEISHQAEIIGQINAGIEKSVGFADAPAIAAGTVVEFPLSFVEQINGKYAQAKDVLAGLGSAIPKGEFSTVAKIQADIASVASALEDLTKPFNAVFDLLKPIEPLLGVVDLVAKFTVDPVIDTILNVLKIDKVIDDASKSITAKLPSVGALDGVSTAINGAIGAVNDLVGTDDPAGIGSWIDDYLIDKLLSQAIQTGEGFVKAQLGDLSAGGLGIGIEIPKPLRGSDDDNALQAFVKDVILIGDAQNNTITASGGDNLLFGGEGDDTLIGTELGVDIALFSGIRDQYSVFEDGSGSIKVRHESSLDFQIAEGTDTLINVDRMIFADGVLAFDDDGAAGQAYRIYKAAFARTPDNDGLKFWINQMDDGMGLRSLADGFVNSQEFKSVYGNNPSHYDFVQKLYQNVLDRDGEDAGVAFWVGELDAGRHTMQSVLEGFSESTENIVGVAESIADGIFLT